jgi:hypothetical protein
MTTSVSVFCDTNVVICLKVVETPEHPRSFAAVNAKAQVSLEQFRSTFCRIAGGARKLH